MVQGLTDLVRAHWKAVIAAVAFVLIQELDANTADWVVAVLGTLGVIVKGNNEDAKRRVYKNR